jgi:putative FmdB family regulatory protein
MPIYEYACSCGNTFEVMIIRTDEEPVRCPTCQSTEVERVVSRMAATRAGLSLKPVRQFKKVR